MSNVGSDLTFLQYQSMSSEQKACISNRVHQWAMKARDSLPNEYSLFSMVIAHLLRNAHRYFNLDRPSGFQRDILERNAISDSTKQKFVEEFKEVNWTV